ncbi:MAG: restriction endonuclease subunit S [Luteolibacter sp.]
MTLDTFFKKFDTFAGAPNAVAKIRELVLQLAVQGKLVEQKHSDGKAKAIFSDGLPDEGECRYEIPATWIWIRFASAGEQRLGKMLDQKGNRGELKPYLRNTNVQWMRFQLDDIKELRLAPEELEEFRLQPDDLLICEGGEPGRCAIWRDPHQEMYFQKAIHRVRPRKGILSEYLAICLRVDAQNGVLAKKFTGATIKHFTGRSLREYSIALPPLAEQRRIVAKVDELMALCDRLESEQQERQEKHAALARASLARFAEAPTPANLNLLFHKSYTVPPADLRKSILTLAAQGRLVEQVPDKLKLKSDPNSDFSENEIPYPLPLGWKWKRLGAISEFVGGSQPPKSKFIYEPKDGYTRFIQIRDFKSDSNLTFIPSNLANRPFNADDVMIGRYGPPVFQILRGLSGTYNVALMKAIPDKDLITKDFLFYLLQEPRIQDRVIADSERTAGQTGIRKPLLEAFVVGVPPLAEQRRIVAKVDELMALVDALETQLATARTSATHLLEAVVAELSSL